MTPEQKKQLDEAKRVAAELERSIELMESGAFRMHDTRPGHSEDSTADWIAHQTKVLNSLRAFIASVEE